MCPQPLLTQMITVPAKLHPLLVEFTVQGSTGKHIPGKLRPQAKLITSLIEIVPSIRPFRQCHFVTLLTDSCNPLG
jgi:hypothetical protein